jgi:LemA protein
MSDDQKKLSDADADRVLSRAAKLAAHDQNDDRVSKADLKAGALEVGIDPHYVDRAEQEIARERALQVKQDAIAKSMRAQRKKTLALVSAIVVVIVIGITGMQMANVNARYTAVETAQGQLDNVMQRRRDLVPSLLALAKASATDEAARIASLEALSQKISSAKDANARIADDEALTEAMTELHQALASRPSMGASPLFVRLSDEMAGSANRISVERKRAVEAIAAYRAAVRGPIGGLARALAGLPAEITDAAAR